MNVAMRLEENSMPVTESGCLIWLGGVANRYGVTTIRRMREYTHRLAWELVNGKVPAGMSVCHRCDVPLCVNPKHLFLGTQADNTRDRTLKGRSCCGESHHKAKLIKTDVLEIRGALGLSNLTLSAIYGVSPTTISEIRAGRTWKHVRGENL